MIIPTQYSVYNKVCKKNVFYFKMKTNRKYCVQVSNYMSSVSISFEIGYCVFNCKRIVKEII